MSRADTSHVLWTEAEATIATRGQATQTFRATGVSIDSRSIAPGDLFIALKGPTFDGHDFAARAAAAGAAVVVIDHRPDDLPENAPALLVSDTMTALWDFGRAARARIPARIAAVTGSVGKTSTKEALLTVLAAGAPTYASTGNLNNHWGAPLSLARMPRNVTYGIFELGMNHAGEVSPLAKLVRPEVAIITTIDAAHLEFFKSTAEIADAKAEIFDGLDPDGTALLPSDNPHFERLVQHARQRGIGTILGFGKASDADIRLISCDVQADGNLIEADLFGRRVTYRTAAPGQHLAVNSLAVLGAVRALGADIDAALAAFAAVETVNGRGKREVVTSTSGKIVLIDESYNASPVAVRAALQLLGATPKADGRRIAILGDMRELGPQANVLHQNLAADVIAAGIDRAFLVGPLMRELYDRLPAPMQGGHYADSDKLAAAIGRELQAGDTVLVKGSLGTRMAPIVAAIRSLGSSAGSSAQETPAFGGASVSAARGIGGADTAKRAANGQ
ncbi:MAG: UDP-N-acetylmuramoylalanyl-D-glutamyl-2,6-diaminopimelate--D-alanyl-D-alanine ligase [Rhodospirillaceae bacterium]|nr:MAG: UDP-N-acetylmuramoylalanyl-D-glutamyl-2,6-diaminopimelate--D-alanyl-D-alanine ligase [Rhodospirillaceae bacterium]